MKTAPLILAMSLAIAGNAFFVGATEAVAADVSTDRKPSIGDHVVFQGASWQAMRGASLTPVTFMGERAIRFAPGDFGSVALLKNEVFESGTLEFDVASDAHSSPTIALFASDDGEKFGTLAINRWPVQESKTPPTRLRQAVVTSNTERAIMLSFHARQPAPDSMPRWFHVRMTIDDDICRIFIDDDEEAALVVGNPFDKTDGSRIGLTGSAFYVTNVRLQNLAPPKSTPPN